MAITKTKTIQRVSVYPAVDSTAASSTNSGNRTINVSYEFKYTDSSDSDLPGTTHSTKTIFRYDADGEATDISGEDAFVQSVCNLTWS